MCISSGLYYLQLPLYGVVAYVQLSMELYVAGPKHNIMHINTSNHFETF